MSLGWATAPPQATGSQELAAFEGAPAWGFHRSLWEGPEQGGQLHPSLTVSASSLASFHAPQAPGGGGVGEAAEPAGAPAREREQGCGGRGGDPPTSACSPSGRRRWAPQRGCCGIRPSRATHTPAGAPSPPLGPRACRVQGFRVSSLNCMF